MIENQAVDGARGTAAASRLLTVGFKWRSDRVSDIRPLRPFLRMLVKHSRSLPERQSDLRSMFDSFGEKAARLFQIVARRAAAKLLNRDEGRRIAANVARAEPTR